MNIKLLANLYLVIALLLGAMLPVMLDIAGSANISVFLFYAYCIGAISTFAILVFTKRTSKLLAHVKNPKSFFLIAAIGLLNYAFLEYGLAYAEKFISASLATVIYRTYPLLMLIFLPFVLRERVTKIQIAAITLGVASIYIAFTGGGLSIFNAKYPAMILLVVIVAIASALATVLVKKYSFDMVTGMFIFNIANAAFFGLFALTTHASFVAFSLPEMIALLYVGIVYNAFTGILYYSAFRMLKSAFVANIYFLSPFITIFYAYIILKESILPYYLAIAGLVTVGVIMQKFDKPGSTYVKTKSNSQNTSRLLFDVTSAFLNTRDDRIYNTISSGGRVLAINIKSVPKTAIEKAIASINESNAIIYADYYDMVNNDERNFIRESTKASEEDNVIMCAAPHVVGEEILNRIAAMSEFYNEKHMR
ncbi:MAG: DMT family transporter [Candidatus Micrarchaeia archaeon]